MSAGVHVVRLVLGELDTNCWLVDDGDGGPTVVVDPAGDAEQLLSELAGRDVSSIVLTHGHFDHLGAADALRERTGAPLMIHRADGPLITSAQGTGALMFGLDHSTKPAERLLEDGDTIAAGRLVLTVVHTPGHTRGCICLLCDGHVFSGDTLFAGSVGRTDFPGGDPVALKRSIVDRLAPLADDLVVHPGHGPDTTIGRERRVNPFFPRS